LAEPADHAARDRPLQAGGRRVADFARADHGEADLELAGLAGELLAVLVDAGAKLGPGPLHHPADVFFAALLQRRSDRGPHRDGGSARDAPNPPPPRSAPTAAAIAAFRRPAPRSWSIACRRLESRRDIRVAANASPVTFGRTGVAW